MMMMRPLGSLLLLTCGLLLSNQHANAVTELTDANFFDYAKDKDVLLVDFYAPWCSDCKALDPDFENAASNLGTRSVDLAKVDCFGAGKGLCSTYGVKQWPTLKNFNRGQYTGDYTGGLSTAEIAGYITTVENSVHPVVNPYAAPYTPQASAVVTQQCVAKCKISRISNKQPCYARCKPKSYGKKPILPQPVINEKSCAKCRQPAIAGKFSNCTKPMVNICDAVFPMSSLAGSALPPPPPAADINLSNSKVNINTLKVPQVSAGVNLVDTVSLHSGLQEPTATALLNDNRVYPSNVNFYYPRMRQSPPHPNYEHRGKNSLLLMSTADSAIRAVINRTVENEYDAQHRESKASRGRSHSNESDLRSKPLSNGLIQLLKGQKGLNGLMSKLRRVAVNNEYSKNRESTVNRDGPYSNESDLRSKPLSNGLIQLLKGQKGLNGLMSKLRVAVNNIHANSNLPVHILSSGFAADKDNGVETDKLDSNYPQIYRVVVPSDAASQKASTEGTGNEITVLQMPGGLLVPFFTEKDLKNSRGNKDVAHASYPTDSNATLRKDIYKEDVSPLNQTYAKNERNKATAEHGGSHSADGTPVEGFTSQLKGERKDSSLLNSVIFKTRLNETSDDDNAEAVYDLALGQPSELKGAKNSKIQSLSSASSAIANGNISIIQRAPAPSSNKERKVKMESNEGPGLSSTKNDSTSSLQKQSPLLPNTERTVKMESGKYSGSSYSVGEKTSQNELPLLPNQEKKLKMESQLQNELHPVPNQEKKLNIESTRNASLSSSLQNASSTHLQEELNVSTVTQSHNLPAPMSNRSNKKIKKTGAATNSTENEDDTVHLKGGLHPAMTEDTTRVANQSGTSDIQSIMSGKVDGELSLSSEDEMDIFKVAEKLGNMGHVTGFKYTVNKDTPVTPINEENDISTHAQDHSVKKRNSSSRAGKTEKADNAHQLTASHETRNVNKQHKNVSFHTEGNPWNMTLANISESLTTVLHNLSFISPKLSNFSNKLSTAFQKVMNVSKGQELLSPKLAYILSQMTNISQRLQTEVFAKKGTLKAVKDKRTNVGVTPSRTKMGMLMKLMGYALSALDVKGINVKKFSDINGATINLARGDMPRPTVT